MLPTLALLLGLPLALAAEPPTCTPLVAVTLDNATIPRLLGQWVFISGAYQYPPHQEEMKTLKYAVFSFFAGTHEDELNVTETMRVNDTCVTRTTSKIHIFWHNSTLVHAEDQVLSMAELIQSDKDLLILKHITSDFVGLSLSARTPNVSKEHLEEFKAHLHCLGFTDDEIFVASEKDACPVPGEKMDQGDGEPQQE